MLEIGEEYPEGHEPVERAFNIRNSEGGTPLENIKILICWVKNYANGAVIQFDIDSNTKAKLRAAHKADETGGAFAAKIEDRLRDDAPKDISFINVHFINCHGSGIYVKPYVSKMRFHHGSIVKSGSCAIYLDSGTQENTISDSVFEDNGRYQWDWENKKIKKGYGKKMREAIAVDSSAFNVITGNTFRNNGSGGVYLYKNCYQYANDLKEILRFQHSKHNRIENNRFYSEPVGVWIASRQSRGYKDWIFKEYMGCGDSVVYESGLPLFKTKYFRDYAEDNDVIGNLFYKNKKSVIVEDDGAEIRDNLFFKNSSIGIHIGSRIRWITSAPTVRGTVVTENSFKLVEDDAVEVEQRYGARDSYFENNSTWTRPYYAPCTSPFWVPAQNAPDKTCRMEYPYIRFPPTPSTSRPSPGGSYPHDSDHFFKDTTREGYSRGVWGRGDFVCDNGNWEQIDGYCCAGPDCR